ncbi:ATP-binding protein [Streptomyces rameus]|uniref:ATP-binding protein n=1 Tax=Streptomyces rameus TaxID=68261 RepID=A0ABP6NT26_9ACTN
MHAPPHTPPPFTQRLSSTPRGARLARRLALAQLDVWGVPLDSAVAEAVGGIVAELAANAVTHGRVPGRDFELTLALLVGSVRIEVSDTLAERQPPGPGQLSGPDPLAEAGRGLLLVDALADRWEVVRRDPPGKTVRAEVDVPSWKSLSRAARQPSAGRRPVLRSG